YIRLLRGIEPRSMSFTAANVNSLDTNFRTPDMGGRKPVRFLGFRARLRPRNASPIPCRGTWCESRSSPRKAFRGLAIDAANGVGAVAELFDRVRGLLDLRAEFLFRPLTGQAG